MGMFDSVMAKCIICGEGNIEFQSKAGDCSLETFDPERVPMNIAKNIEGDMSKCDECGGVFLIQRELPDYDSVPMKVLFVSGGWSNIKEENE